MKPETQRWAETQAGPLIEAAPDAMILVDEAGTILFANAQTERLFGWPRSELVGKPIEVLLPDRYRASHPTHRGAYGRTAKLRPMGQGLELSGLRRDGSEFPVEIALSPIMTEHGQLVSAAVRDVSQRKEAERAAKLAHERLVSAVESFQDAFAIFDADDRLVLCNSAYRRALPTSWSGPAVGVSFDAILDAEIAAEELGPESTAELRGRRLAYHRAPEGAFETRTRDGRSLRIIERPMPEGGRVTTIVDLTADVQNASELREAREAADAANAAKSEFLRSMSHELRTPLNAVLGFTQLLQRDRTLAERPRRLIDHVHKGGEHLLRLIDDVLDLARVESGAVPLSLEPVAVSNVLEEVRSTLAPMAQRRGIVIEAVPPPAPLPFVRADRTRLAQIVLNFGSNAIKYGKAQGRTVIRARVEGRRVRVVVSDDGIGIPEDRQERIFQAFYRAGQETGPIEGTGIGLALARRLAVLMDGEVGFRSEEGKGSEFWVDLPIEDAGLALPERVEVATWVGALSSSEGTEVPILYVEDNPANVAFMEELVLGLPRVRLLTAPTGELGVEIARAHHPAIVILDINLPGISGFEVLRRLRESDDTRDIPVLALSASAMERDVKRAQDAGFARYLTKPVKVDELVSALEELLPR
jgi:PAS domain S-box-containing protein